MHTYTRTFITYIRSYMRKQVRTCIRKYGTIITKLHGTYVHTFIHAYISYKRTYGHTDIRYICTSEHAYMSYIKLQEITYGLSEYVDMYLRTATWNDAYVHARYSEYVDTYHAHSDIRSNTYIAHTLVQYIDMYLRECRYVHAYMYVLTLRMLCSKCYARYVTCDTYVMSYTRDRT
jgi:hypothetical protein